MFKCRKRRTERESMLSTLGSKKIEISVRMNGSDLKILFEEASIETVSRFVESTVSKKVEAYDAQRIDEWDIELLDRNIDEDRG
jgi:hypothetical protein